MTKIVTVRLDGELHRQARMKLAEQRTSFQVLLEAFIQEWVHGKRIMELPKAAQATDVAQLEYILEHGAKDQIEWTRGNLKTFVEAIDSQAHQSGDLQADEKRLVEEYRAATLERRRHILALAAKVEDLGPEVVAPRNRRTGERRETERSVRRTGKP